MEWTQQGRAIMTDDMGKVLVILGVLLLALASAPTGAWINPQDSWVITHWEWIKRALRLENSATPVTVHPVLFYLGVLLSVIGIALS
jgi:hypothetical protein